MELAYDPAEAVALLARADRKLAKVIKKAGPFTHQPQKLQSPFQALLRAIVYQQISGKAGAAILGRVAALYPGRHGLKPQAILSTRDEVLRGAGLSQGKLLAVKDLAAKTLDGTVPTLARLTKMEDEAIVERLVQVRGIGRWTVEMLLIFRLGRPDVLPVTDFGVRSGFMLIYGTSALPKPAEMIEYGERWRPFRSVASWYLWRAVEHAREKEKLVRAKPIKRARKER